MTQELEHAPRTEVVETTLQDVPALRALQAQSWIDTYPNESAGITKEWVTDRVAGWSTPEGIQKSREFMSNVFDNPQHFHRIAKVGDEVVGLVHVSNTDTEQHLEGLYIDKHYRGSGLAQTLLDQAFSHLDLTRPVTLEVAEYNERAIAFYQKYGFEIVEGSQRLYIDTIPTINMIRQGDST